MTKPFASFFPAVLALVLATQPLLAAQCEYANDPSPESQDQTQISFYNSTHYAVQLYWAGFDGFLVDEGLLQPGDEAYFDTYIGHQWYVEVLTEEGPYCAGPVAPYDYEPCNARIWFDGGPGFDADLCNYMG